MTFPDFEIDHVFVFVEPGAPEARGLASAGLRESFRRRHPGQGTANVCYCLDDAYLELLWVDDAAAVASEAVAPTRLAERAAW
ncbi:MAG TPA: VOC family protein, partial [Arenibaculum sp.]|nr:VOC family protein [Arenibaculum sp.]